MLLKFLIDYRMRKAKEKGLLIRSAANMSTSNTTESTNSGVGGGGGSGSGGAMTTVVFDSSSSSKDNRTSTYTSTTLPLSSSSHHHHHNHHSKANPIYKQRAYLSKGVPVILYEEMSDKPLEDYDENNANSTGGTISRNVGSYYR